MDKRRFLSAAACTAALPGTALAGIKPTRAGGPTLLTVSGRVTHPNRGASDAALDQLMLKHGLGFEQARTYDFAALAALPALEIRPTLEYDARPHRLRGPALSRLLAEAGAPGAASTPLTLRAFDGYTVELRLADVERLNFIVATHLDDAPLPLGGLGPLWAVHDADRIAESAARPLAERFAQCPWGLYSIHLPEERG